MQTLQTTHKRTIHVVPMGTRDRKVKRISLILKELGLDKIGTGKSNLSVSHDSLLYK